MKLFASIFLILAITGCVIANLNPYIPVLVEPKNPIIKCPSSCSSAKDCFMVHPLSDTHFYSCFHGKAMVHQCPSGKAFSDEKHQCLKRTKSQSSVDSLSNAKITKLTEKIVLFEHLIDAFQRKLERVQGVIIESDNKIGLLGKFLLKALKQNKENFCNKQESAASGKATQASEQNVIQSEAEFDVSPQKEDDEATDHGIGLVDDELDQPADISSPGAVAKESAKMSEEHDAVKLEAKMEGQPKESAANTTSAKSSSQQKTAKPSDAQNVQVGLKPKEDEAEVVVPDTEEVSTQTSLTEEQLAEEVDTEPSVGVATEERKHSEVGQHRYHST